MFMRISRFHAGTIVCLAACAPQSGAPEGEAVDCALGPGAAFTRDCTLEAATAPEEAVFVIHHPDGVFRRFILSRATGEFVMADGAEALDAFTDQDGTVELTVSKDRYRIPPEVLRPDR